MSQGSDPNSETLAPRDDGDLSERRERLERELKRRADLDRSASVGSRSTRSDASGLALAMRVGSEFIAAIIVGGVIGWGIDRLAGSSPWGMVVFLMLGFVAGVLNVMRSAGLMKKQGG